jgi:hypothetical protein
MEDAAITAPHTVLATPEWCQYRYNATNSIYAIVATAAILLHGARWVYTTFFGMLFYTAFFLSFAISWSGGIN